MNKLKNISKIVLTLSLLFTVSNMNALKKKHYTTAAILLSTSLLAASNPEATKAVINFGLDATRKVVINPVVLMSLLASSLVFKGTRKFVGKAINPVTYYSFVKNHPYISAGAAIALTAGCFNSCADDCMAYLSQEYTEYQFPPWLLD